MIHPCSVCSGQAIKQCLCLRQLFCKQHSADHLAQPGNHHFVDITISLTPEERNQLTEELVYRLSTIAELSLKISAHASHLIAKIGKLCSSTIENLNKLALDYQILLQTADYSPNQIGNVQSILTTHLHLDFNSALESLQNAEDYFGQAFFRTPPKVNLTEFLKSHTGQISCLAVTSDKQTIYSGGWDNSIKQWKIADGTVTKLLEGHTMNVTCIALSKNDGFLISGSDDQSVRLWNANDWKCCVLKGHTGRVLSVAVSDDCKWIASGSADQSICIWSLNEQKLYRKLTQHERGVNAVAFCGTSLFSGSSDQTIIEWDINNAERIFTYQTSDSVRCIEISSDYSVIASGLYNGKIQLWKNRSVQIELIGHTGGVRAVKFADNGKKIISASDDSTVRIWNTEQARQLACFSKHSASVMCLSSLKDDLFISGSFDFSLITWDTSTFAMNSVTYFQPADIFHSVIDKNSLFYPSGNSVRRWNLEKNCLQTEFYGHSFPVTCVALYNELIVSGSRDKTVRVWRLNTFSQLAVFEGHSDTVFGVGICGNVVVSGSADKTVRVWSIRGNKVMGVLNGHSDYVQSVAITSDTEKVVSGSHDRTVKVWSIGKMQMICNFNGHTSWVYQVGLSKDDKYAVSGSIGESVRVWDIEKGIEVSCWKNTQEGEEWLLKYPELRMLAERFIP